MGFALSIPKEIADLSKKYLPAPIFKSVVESVIALTFASTIIMFASAAATLSCIAEASWPGQRCRDTIALLLICLETIA